MHENSWDTLSGRLKYLRKKRGLKSKEIAAQSIGIKYGTYQRFEFGHNPSRKNINKILNYYGCKEAWLLTGEGEPFPGARTKYHDVCGPDPAPKPPLFKHMEVDEKYLKDVTIPDTTAQFSPHDAIGMASAVLNSNTSYAYALYLNIVHFDRAIKAENRITILEDKCEKLEKKVAELINIVDELKQRNDDIIKGSSAGAS